MRFEDEAAGFGVNRDGAKPGKEAVAEDAVLSGEHWGFVDFGGEGRAISFADADSNGDHVERYLFEGDSDSVGTIVRRRGSGDPLESGGG